MTTADEAFGKLMTKNALNIPVANPAADASGAARLVPPPAAVPPAPPARAPDPFPEPPPAPAPRRDSTVRIMNVMDTMDVMDGSGDYNPRGADDDDRTDVFTTPTETDLDAVPEEDAPFHRPTAAADAVEDSESAESPDDYPTSEFQGEADGTDAVRVSGDEDALDTDTDMDTATNTDLDPDFREASVVEESGAAGLGLGLDRARRVRRFGYLPLAGIETFELRARDIMAGLVSKTPDQPSLAIVSTARGDGETEVAIRLALAVAKRVDYRIALVDMDVRKPQIARRLGLSSKYFTVMDVLRGGCPLGEALMYGEEENLYVLPSRASDRDGDEVVDVKQVRQLAGQLHSAFDFVILCCGSLDHADAITLCRHAGATALAGFCRHTRASALKDAAARLGEAGVSVAGLLLTGAA